MAANPIVTDRYEYHNERGQLVFSVERLKPKGFRNLTARGRELDQPLGPDGRMLYRLPELLAADPARTVYLVEGEKDVERMRSIGQVATTNRGGCHLGWDDSLALHLSGRHVAILPDCDRPGQLHAESVRHLLKPVAASVVIVKLPRLRPPQDISDWLDIRGGTVLELERLVTIKRYRQAGLKSPPKKAALQRELILLSSLSTTQKMVLLALQHYMPLGREDVSMTMRELARASSLHEITAQRVVSVLRSQGILLRRDARAHVIAWDILAGKFK